MMSTKIENSEIKLIECPRDAMQGLSHFVPTQLKAKYLDILLRVGFDTLDFGSFVSSKAIPQMKDTAEVLSLLDLEGVKTKLLAIVANRRGVEEAVRHPEIAYIGFPFSVSETFQQRNTNTSRIQALDLVEQMLTLCHQADKTAVVYLSMGFGNPYGEEWSPEMVSCWVAKLVEKGVRVIAVSDTTGVSTPEKIKNIYTAAIRNFPNIEFGLHLHSTPAQRTEKIEAAFEVGCRRFDSALSGYGGCPMADNHLTGNIATEEVIDYLTKKGISLKLDLEKWAEAITCSAKIFY